jgi:hypothetical protein
VANTPFHEEEWFVRKITGRVLCLALFLACSFPILAQTDIADLCDGDARSLGMGSTFTIFSEGYSALYGNPAAFAEDRGSLTILDVTTRAYMKPTVSNFRNAAAILSGSLTAPEALESLDSLIAGNGLGGGISAGFGWTGAGIGLGFNLAAESIAVGDTAASATLSGMGQINAIFGMAVPLEFGAIHLRFGGDARAFLRLQSSAGGWDFDTLLSGYPEPSALFNTLRGLDFITGYGIVADFGATAQLGPLVVGGTWRGLGPIFRMGDVTLGEMLDLDMPGGDRSYQVSPVLSLGAGLRFQTGVVRSSLYAETTELASLAANPSDALDFVHLGGELRIANFFTVRAGIDKGWTSFGLGFDFIIIEVDAALFTQGVGPDPLSQSRTGFALQAALRF